MAAMAIVGSLVAILCYLVGYHRGETKLHRAFSASSRAHHVKRELALVRDPDVESVTIPETEPAWSRLPEARRPWRAEQLHDRAAKRKGAS